MGHDLLSEIPKNTTNSVITNQVIYGFNISKIVIFSTKKPKIIFLNKTT